MVRQIPKMNPIIKVISSKIIIGKRTEMLINEEKIVELWKSFISHYVNISNKIDTDLISLRIYPDGYFKNFNSEMQFEYWAAAEVSEIKNLPEGMEFIKVPEGKYAVFNYRGSASDKSIYQYIFSQWMPLSGYDIDNRPHFEIIGEKYNNFSPDSEEEIYIPIIPKIVSTNEQ